MRLLRFCASAHKLRVHAVLGRSCAQKTSLEGSHAGCFRSKSPDDDAAANSMSFGMVVAGGHQQPSSPTSSQQERCGPREEWDFLDSKSFQSDCVYVSPQEGAILFHFQGIDFLRRRFLAAGFTLVPLRCVEWRVASSIHASQSQRGPGQQYLRG